MQKERNEKTGSGELANLLSDMMVELLPQWKICPSRKESEEWKCVFSVSPLSGWELLGFSLLVVFHSLWEKRDFRIVATWYRLSRLCGQNSFELHIMAVLEMVTS